MFQKSNITRTQIADLPELTESDMRSVSGGLKSAISDMRIVSGGLKSGVYGCGVRIASVSLRGDRTQYNTNGDWDSD